MNRRITLIAVLLSCWSVLGFAQGIAEGEPDPNTSPATDRARDIAEPTHLIDDRAPCPNGQKRYQRMHCVSKEKAGPPAHCQRSHGVFVCSKTAPKAACKAPKVLAPVYKCD